MGISSPLFSASDGEPMWAEEVSPELSQVGLEGRANQRPSDCSRRQGEV